jgi:hypothetical protein
LSKCVSKRTAREPYSGILNERDNSCRDSISVSITCGERFDVVLHGISSVSFPKKKATVESGSQALGGEVVAREHHERAGCIDEKIERPPVGRGGPVFQGSLCLIICADNAHARGKPTAQIEGFAAFESGTCGEDPLA